MIKRRIIYSTLLSATLVLSLSGCEKLLEINPKQSIDSSTALTSKEGIDAALVAVYSRLQSSSLYGRDYIALSEALSDNSIHTGNSSHLTNEAKNSRNAHFSNWQMAYYAINQANLVLDALEAGTYDEDWSSSIKGQALFLRALCYHDLMRTYAYDPTAIIEEYNYGGVPLMLVGVDDVAKIGSLKRAAISDVYRQINEDLELAYQNLSKNVNLPFPHKPSPAAVSALHSRVALYQGDYALSAEKASLALQETKATFSSNANFLADWQKDVHPESIFELKFNLSENIGSDLSLRATFTSRATYDATTFSIQAVLAVDPEFYATYEEKDIRRGLIRNGVGKNAPFLEMYKFISKSGTINLDNVPVLRVSEVYLNRAEAYFKQGAGFYDLALADLNKIRTRAGLEEVNLTGEALGREILQQRRLELAFEGHRWFDLKRNGLDVVKESGTIPFTDYRMLARIPVREVNTTTELEQNFNY